MKKQIILTVLLALCLLLSTAAIASAATWSKCAGNNQAEYYFDKESVRYNTTNSGEQVIEVWIHGIYRNVQNDGSQSFKNKLWLKLDSKKMACLINYRYDSNGNTLLSSRPLRVPWNDCIPGSSGERIYDVVRQYVEQNL